MSTLDSRWDPTWGYPEVRDTAWIFPDLFEGRMTLCDKQSLKGTTNYSLAVLCFVFGSNPGSPLCAQLFLRGQQEEHVCVPGAYH